VEVAIVTPVRITELWRYPVKSTAGRPATTLAIEPWGAVGDRRWAIVDPDGVYLTARALPELFRLVATPDEAGLVLEYGAARVEVPTPYGGPRVAVAFSRLLEAVDAGPAAAAFLTEAFDRPLRLVWQPDPRERTVNPGNGGLPGEVLSLADAGPLLLTTESSLDQVREWAEDEKLAMRRFRPNVVVDGSEPFAEDGWASVRLGSVDFRVQGPCDRCVMTTIEPDTLEKGKEPIRSLSRHHKWDGKVWFGVWLVPQAGGRIEVGDDVVPLG